MIAAGIDRHLAKALPWMNWGDEGMEVLDRVPSHVPPELVRDIDYYALMDGKSDGGMVWEEARADAAAATPLVYTPHNGGHWIAMRADDVEAIFRESATFSNRIITAPDNPGQPMLPDQSDPPMHAEYRNVISSQFTPQSVAGIEEEITQLAIELIDGFKVSGHCEFAADFAQKLPVYTFLSIVDVPRDDLAILMPTVKAIASTGDPSAKIEPYQRLEAYLNGWIEKRLAEPGDDLISRVVHTKIDGRALTHSEMLSFCVGIFFAGLDTVASFLTFVVAFLAKNPEARRHIRDNPDKLFQIGEELLRRFPVLAMARVVAEDTTYKNIDLRQGDIVLCPSAIYNLSTDKFDDPAGVDFGRKPTKHLTFGAGRHTCLGSFLARTELKIFLREWLARIPDFALDETRPVRTMSGPVTTFLELHLRWDVESCL